jgi:RHS repeat-associated protein
VRFGFKANQTGAIAPFFLHSGAWGQADYRRWSLYLVGGCIQREYYITTVNYRACLLTLSANTWYDALLSIESGGKLRIVVWQRDNPNNRAEENLDLVDTDWDGRKWQYMQQSNTGIIDNDLYQEYTLKAVGQRTWMDDASGHSAWSYDQRRRMVYESKVISGSGTFVTLWTYNSADQATGMTYPGGNAGQLGEVVSYAYHLQGALNMVTGGSSYVTGTSYDAAGRALLRSLGNNRNTQYTYYPWSSQGRRLQYLKTGAGSPVTPTQQHFEYDYDPVGNIDWIKDYLAGGTQTQTFHYDALNRLIDAVASGGTGGTYPFEQYIYSTSSGNLTSKATQGYNYNAQVTCAAGTRTIPHAASGMGTNSYIYDCNGNMITRTISGVGTYNLSYDAENHLTGVSGAATASFVYDGDGKRVKGTVGSTTTTYLGNYFEWTGSTSTMKKYYYAGEIRIAMRTGSGTGTSGLLYLYGDHLGSTNKVANPDGTLYTGGEQRYKPWGEQRYPAGASTLPTTFQFTGQRVESGLSLYYYGARWYDPYLARFVQADTIVPNPGQPMSWDRYMYVLGNPLRYNDPTGHVCSDPEDPTPTCETSGNSTKLLRVNYKKDPDNLTKGGRKAYEYYLKARNRAGWWNNNEIGTLTIEQFLGIYLLYEASGIDEVLPWIKDATGAQLYLQPPDDFGGNSPYCTGEVCRNGILNFMASYQGYGKYGESSKLVTRFATLSIKPILPPRYRSETLAGAAADIGNGIIGNRSDYQTGDPYTVPFHWGNDMSQEDRTFYILTVTLIVLYHYP